MLEALRDSFPWFKKKIILFQNLWYCIHFVLFVDKTL